MIPSMLLHFLFATSLFFGGCAANTLAVERPLPSTAFENHEVHLPCLGSSNNHQNTDQNPFLSVNFAVNNNTLFANNNPIFPPSIPMRLNAKRYRELDKSATDIPLTFSLDAKPLPSHTGDTFLLKITLFDLLGEPVVTDTVSVDLLQDPEGTLEISRVRLDPTQGSDRLWQLKYWRTRVNACLISMKNSATSTLSFTGGKECSQHHQHTYAGSPPNMNSEQPNTNPSNPSSDTSAFSSSAVFRPHHRFHGHHGHRGHRATYRYLRQAILPGLLGMTAALIACGLGFIIGKLSISVYLHLRDHKEGAANRPNRSYRSRRVNRKDVEDGCLDEKEQLLVISRGTM